jgi:hypothetical protein
MKIKSLLIGLSAAMLAAAPITTSFAPPANAGGVNEFFNNTVGQLKKSQNREGFVKGLAEKAFYFHKGRYNIMVFNLSQGYSNQLRGVQYFKQFSYNGVNYGLWAFRDGRFTNTGDGGYINWAFQGSWKRYTPGATYVQSPDGKVVDFTPRS